MLDKDIKNAIRRIVGLASTFADIFEDGKVSNSEWVKLAVTSPMIPSIITDAKTAQKAKVKMSPELSKQISDEIALSFDIKNDNVEAKIEEAIALVAKGHAVANEAIEFYEELVEFKDSFKKAA